MKRLLLFLVFIFCLQNFINCRFENRIINGEETPLAKFMFLPKIYESYSYTDSDDGAPHTKALKMCSSTIISNRHVLTAAHCVKYFINPFNDSIFEESIGYPYFVDVRPTENDTLPYFDNTDFTKFGITPEVHIHQNYTENLENDIAILEFPEGVNFNITPVTLAKDYVDNYDDVAIAAGYGLYLFNVAYQNVSRDIPPTLRNVNVSIRPFLDIYNISEDDPEIKNLNASEKANFDNNLNDIKNRLICAGISGELPQRGDSGDSGGPLLYELNGKTYQLGVYSFRNKNNVRGPGCYMRVSFYCDWIEKNTDGEAKCQEMYVKVSVTQPVTNSESISTTQQATTTTESISITESDSINEHLLPTNENSPIKAELKNGASTFVMNFGFFWIVFFLKFIYVSLF